MLSISLCKTSAFSPSRFQGSRSLRTIVRPRISSWFFGPLSAEVDPGDVKGTKLKILKYPHPKLRAVNEEITVFDDALVQSAREMLMIMHASEGVGLAAPQVGINKRLMVFNEKADDTLMEYEMILANPVIIAHSEATDLKEEGCLSFPQIFGKVNRWLEINVEYQNTQGEKKSLELKGYAARIFQHEFDHLDKVLFIDKLIDADKKTNEKRLAKYVKKYGAGGAE
eukprot:CAMPEP_0119035062 /NCGR_PEP_ID=MMETSP1177-20130426/2040_1 /TAXON_ID=2985 /ORGANISM="Ochromonas sp, Strain CCMP1899" /LENGTH=225 /DNA_ID=CAMNT_0006992955 /DNA_START=89 /DNA_END=766 /DNA_ORIENTATION=+